MMDDFKTPVSALQELMAARKLPMPKYLEEDFGGGKFKYTVYAGGVTACGISMTKKAAKHECAKNALFQLQSKSRPRVVHVKETSVVTPLLKNYVGILNELCSKRQEKYPDYISIPNQDLATNTFFVKCSFRNSETIGTGVNKKDAKQDAAMRMLQFIENENKYTVVHSRTVVQTDKIDEIIRFYETHSIQQSRSESANITSTSVMSVVDESNLDILQLKVKELGIEYEIKVFQTIPDIMMSLKIKGTNAVFLENGKTKDEALKKILQKVIMIKRSGYSFTINDADLISL